MKKHEVTPVANPNNADATVCSTCGAPVAKVNTQTAKSGWKHYVSSAAYKARMLEMLAR